MGANQPRGIRAGRKLKTHRREQRWKSLKYSKANTVATMKAKPLGSASMAKGIVLEKMCVAPLMWIAPQSTSCRARQEGRGAVGRDGGEQRATPGQRAQH